MINKKYGTFLVAVTFLLTGCASQPQGVGLDQGGPSPIKHDMNIWLKPVQIQSIQDAAAKSSAETSMTLSVEKYIEETQMFNRSQILPGTIGANDEQLQFRFDKFTVHRSASPAYFPLALLTLTMYIWANGAIYIDTIDIEATLIAFDSKGQQLAEFKQKINTEKNVGFNDPEYQMLSGIGERTQVVRGLLEQYGNYLKTTKKGAVQ